MSKIKKLFVDKVDETNIEVWSTNESTIWITTESNNNKVDIELDVSTAIAFSKELRKVIGEAKSFEY